MQQKIQTREEKRMRLTKMIKDIIKDRDTVELAALYIGANETFGVDSNVVDRILAPYIEIGQYEVVKNAKGRDVVRRVMTEQKVKQEADSILTAKPQERSA